MEICVVVRTEDIRYNCNDLGFCAFPDYMCNECPINEDSLDIRTFLEKYREMIENEYKKGGGLQCREDQL